MDHSQAPASEQAVPAAASRKIHDGWLLVLFTLLALVIRLPYWRTIPAAGDEATQAIVALRIAQGHELPLVGNDAYAGPFFFYLLALLFRLGVADPLVGRTVVLVTGTLTVAITYAWVRRLGGNRMASSIAALLVAINPHLILLNSHLGGTTYLLPFFTTSFLWLLSSAVDSDHRGWLIASAIAAGLAIQSNPIAALLVAGSWIWATFRLRHSPRLGRHWPLWPLVGGLCVALVYSPVIIYNVTSSGLNSLSALEQRPYLWQPNPTVYTFYNNERRLALQLVRQTSGVLRGGETFQALMGVPLLYLMWMLAGLVFTLYRISLLPIMAVLPFFFLVPYFSRHYGMVFPVRFTSLLTPVFAAGMGFFLAAWLERIIKLGRSAGQWMPAVAFVFVAALMAYPFVSLFQYYDFIKENHLSGRALLDLCRQIVAANQGEPVYISDVCYALSIPGIPYVPRTCLIFANIYQDFLSPEQIVGRLFERPGPAAMFICDQDIPIIRQVASITPWPSAANEEAHWLGYGLYTLDTEVPLTKPDIVLTGNDVPDIVPREPVGISLGSGIELIGCDTLDSVLPGETLKLTCYWQAVGSLPQATYIGFVHLYDSATPTVIIAQDDHLLGQDQYPVNAWQPDEVVLDHYSLHVPYDMAAGRYALRLGVYTWPDLIRLNVPGYPDDIIELEPVDIGQ